MHFVVDCVSESSESYVRNNMIGKPALDKMGLLHTPEGWQFKSEKVKEDEEARGSSSIPHNARSEFEKALLKEIRSLKVIYLGIREDVSEIKEHLNLENQNKEEADEEEVDEEESSKEGSTPDESAIVQEEENKDEDAVEESNSDMLLRTYLKKTNKEKI